MSFLDFRSRRAESLIVFDIGNGSVGAAHLGLGKGLEPTIDHVKRIPLTIKERVHTKALVSSIHGAIKEIQEDFLKHKMHAHDAAVFLASPWHITHARTLSVNEKRSFTVTHELMDHIVEQEIEEFHKQTEGDLVLLERGIASIRVNGYRTSQPYGKNTNRLEVSIYASFALKSFIKELESELHGPIHLRRITFHAFPLAAFEVIQKVFHDSPDYTFIDITSEITDIIAVRGGRIIDTGSFPVGKNILIRKVADRFNIDPGLAETYVRLFDEGRAASDLTSSISTLSDVVREEWQAYFYQIVADMYQGEPVPRKIFVTVDEDVADIFLSYIKEPITTKVFLSNKTLSDFSKVAPHVQHDSFLAIESVYLGTV